MSKSSSPRAARAVWGGASPVPGGGRRRAVLRVLHAAAALAAMPSWPAARAKRDHAVAPFDAVESRLACTLHLAPGAAPAVSVQAEPAVLDALRIRTEGRTLVLDAGSYQTSQGVLVAVSFTTALRRLRIGGSGEVELVQPSSDMLDVVLDGTTRFSASRLNLRRLALDARGSDDVTLLGTVERLDLSLSGSGEVMAYGLSSDVAEVRSSGSGDVQVNVKRQLVSRIEGSGSVHYTGRPALKTLRSGSGELIDAN